MKFWRKILLLPTMKCEWEVEKHARCQHWQCIWWTHSSEMQWRRFALHKRTFRHVGTVFITSTHHNRIPQAPTMTSDVEPDDTMNGSCACSIGYYHLIHHWIKEEACIKAICRPLTFLVSIIMWKSFSYCYVFYTLSSTVQLAGIWILRFEITPYMKC